MIRILKLVFVFFFLVALAQSCRKDPKVEPQKTPGPTPVNLTDIFPANFGIPELPADNPLSVEGIYLGRMLFYDPVLSFDSTISCGSCHIQKFAFSDGSKLSTGIFGLKTGRNSPSLINMAYSKRFFWDGRTSTLREQLFEPIQAHNEMGMNLPLLEKKLRAIERYKTWFAKAFNSTPNIWDMAKAIEQFELTLVSSKSKFNKFFPGNFQYLTASETQGAVLFNGFTSWDPNGVPLGADCFHCHGGALMQQNNPSFTMANNGLDSVLTDFGLGKITGKPSDNGKFKSSTLLNIAVSGPYMHDGRFKTLEEVIDHYSDHVNFNSPNFSPLMNHDQRRMMLTTQQKADLKAFLLTTTDTAFLNNPAFSNPFQ